MLVGRVHLQHTTTPHLSVKDLPATNLSMQHLTTQKLFYQQYLRGHCKTLRVCRAGGWPVSWCLLSIDCLLAR